MSIVTVQNTRYTADPLYQWDNNQVLEIRGLSLAFVPEIHFVNDNMDRAIVRQARKDGAGVITVDVPNSLLQKAGKLTVYVCGYAGGSFKTFYKLELVVKARVKPSDYTLEDDPEVYSFNELENLFTNSLYELEEIARAAVDNTKASANSANTAIVSVNSARQAAEDSARAASEAADHAREASEAAAEEVKNAILKSEITEVVKVTELPANPASNVLYVIV